MAPETRYVRTADGTSLAYQLGGGGPHDLVFLHGFAVPIDLLSEDPGFVRLRKRLDTFSRTVWFDRRGWGASEGDPKDSLAGLNFDASSPCSTPWVSSERRWPPTVHLAGERFISP